MKYTQILIVLLFIGCTNIKESQPTTLGTSTTNTATKEKVEDVYIYTSKKKDVSGQEPTKEKDIYIYFLEIRHADIKIPKTKYKDVMGFTAPKDINIPGLPDIGPK
jgi:hypothetical protein